MQIENYLPELGLDLILKEIWEGLTAQNKYISSKYLYDDTGSALFEKITQLPEYYPTRTEKRILQSIDWGFFENLEKLIICEFGSGDHSKISLIIQNIPEEYRRSLTYMPVDISASAVEQSVINLQHRFPEIQLQGVVADFVHQLNFIPDNANRLFCFLGSTIGNFTPALSFEFMHNVNQRMKSGEYFLVGFDTVKDIQILEAAYNDDQKLTAEFNRNILNVVNDFCETNFCIADFKHVAFYNKHYDRIEMHLEAMKDITVESRYFQADINISRGERIHTENSHKFDNARISQIALLAGFQLINIFKDKNNYFNLALLQKA